MVCYVTLLGNDIIGIFETFDDGMANEGIFKPEANWTHFYDFTTSRGALNQNNSMKKIFS